MKNPSSSRYVVLQLADERFDAVEAALAAEEFREGDRARLPVEVAVEINQVGLQQRNRGVEVKRRPSPDVQRAGVARPVRTLQPPCIDPV